ncbi:MAG: helix-turn-helix domain-containing protein [Deltaproteobacteria bacterium]|nr:helix-turn-helix domain-containing protein [Deltaproteobacteria bacterium]
MPKRSGDEGTADSGRVYLANLGERVRKLRERQGLTLKRMAQLSGLSDRFIIEVEKGKANPSLTSLINLAHALQTSLTDLLPTDFADDVPALSGSANKILALLQSRPPEQISRVVACVSSYLEHAKGFHVSLVGMRGAGKTTVGNLLARSLKAPFYELDALIERDTGLSLAEIFDLEGENYYRAVEERVLQRVLKKAPGVIAAGGGLVMNPTSLLLLKLNSFVVWLQASPEALIARVRAEKDERPLGAHPHVRKQLKAILDRRTPYYAQADFLVNTTHQSADRIGKTILHAFRNSANPQRVKS